jgi:hypothetical protein
MPRVAGRTKHGPKENPLLKIELSNRHFGAGDPGLGLDVERSERRPAGHLGLSGLADCYEATAGPRDPQRIIGPAAVAAFARLQQAQSRRGGARRAARRA